MEARKLDLEKRFDDIGWGLLFLAFAALALPNGMGQCVAVAGVGAAMLLLNAVRRIEGVAISWFSTVLGATGLVGAIMALGGLKIDLLALFFVFLGVLTIAAAVVRPSGHVVAA